MTYLIFVTTIWLTTLIYVFIRVEKSVPAFGPQKFISLSSQLFTVPQTHFQNDSFIVYLVCSDPSIKVPITITILYLGGFSLFLLVVEDIILPFFFFLVLVAVIA